MLMERQPSNADWLQAMVGVSTKDKEIIRAVGQENCDACSYLLQMDTVMMRFEKAMYENPDQD